MCLFFLLTQGPHLHFQLGPHNFVTDSEGEREREKVGKKHDNYIARVTTKEMGGDTGFLRWVPGERAQHWVVWEGAELGHVRVCWGWGGGLANVHA